MRFFSFFLQPKKIIMIRVLNIIKCATHKATVNVKATINVKGILSIICNVKELKDTTWGRK